MKRKRAVSIVAAMVLLTINLAAPVQPAFACTAGCTPGFWKQSQHFDYWEMYAPGDLVVEVFTAAEGYVDPGDTLLDALAYRGGEGADGAARILLRAATAMLLNTAYDEANGGIWNYNTWDTLLVVTATNSRLASGDREWMLILATRFDDMNNTGCPL